MKQPFDDSDAAQKEVVRNDPQWDPYHLTHHEMLELCLQLDKVDEVMQYLAAN